MKNLILFILSFFLLPLVATLTAFSLANAQDQSRASIINKSLESFKNFNLLSSNDYKRIKKINKNSFLIPKDLRVKALLSLPKITQEAKAIKTVTRGGGSGYLITYIDKDSIFRKIGLEVGDILVKINGAKLTNSQQVTKVFSNTIKVNNINLELIRDRLMVKNNYKFI